MRVMREVGILLNQAVSLFVFLMHVIISCAEHTSDLSIGPLKVLSGRDPLDEELRTEGIEIIAPHRVTG